MLILPPIRKRDNYGAGYWHASRDNGKRLHKGVDLIAPVDSKIIMIHDGVVNRFGVPYYFQSPSNEKERLQNKLHLIEILLDDDIKLTFFYVMPLESLEVGNKVTYGTPIGHAENLEEIWPGMTNHVHVRAVAGIQKIDPTPFIEV